MDSSAGIFSVGGKVSFITMYSCLKRTLSRFIVDYVSDTHWDELRIKDVCDVDIEY